MKVKAIFLAICSATMFGMLPLLTKYTYNTGLNALSLSFYRYAFLAIIACICCIKRKRTLKLPWEDCKRVLVHASFYTVLTAVLLNYSYQYISTGIATTLHFIYPLIVILICKFCYCDQIDKKTWYVLCMMVIGIACFFERLEFGSMQGLLMAILSSITYAIYLVMLEKKRICHLNALSFSLHLSLYTCIIIFIIEVCIGSFQFPPSWVCMIYLIMISLLSLLALVCMQYASQILGSKLIALFSLFEPITSILLGAFVLHEPLTIQKILGCILILFAVCYLAVVSSHIYKTKSLS